MAVDAPPEWRLRASETNGDCKVLSFAPVTLYCKGFLIELPYDVSELPFRMPKEIRRELLRRGLDEETIKLVWRTLIPYGLGKKTSVSFVDCNLVELKELRMGKMVYYNGSEIGLVIGDEFYAFIDIVESDATKVITSDMIFNECVRKKEAKMLKMEAIRERIYKCIETTGKPCYVSEYIALKISDKVVILKDKDSELGLFKKDGFKLVPMDIDSAIRELIIEDTYATYYTPTPVNRATLMNALRIYSTHVDVNEVECFVSFGEDVFDVCSWIEGGSLKRVTHVTPFGFDVEINEDHVVAIARSINSHEDVLKVAESKVPALYKLAMHVREDDRANLLMSFALIPFCRRELKKVILLIGPTLTGKSTTLSVIEELAGDMVGYINLSRRDYRREVGVVDLILKLYALQDEINVTTIANNLDLVKALSGCSRLTAWRLYKGNLTFRNRATIFLTMNDPSSIEVMTQKIPKDELEALMSRMILIRYTKKMSSSEAIEIINWIRHNRSAALEWALAMGRVLYKLGWKDYQGDLKAKLIDMVRELSELGSVTIVKQDESKLCILKRDLSKVLKSLNLKKEDLKATFIYFSTAKFKGRKVNIVCIPL